jgi:hypothetical protein
VDIYIHFPIHVLRLVLNYLSTETVLPFTGTQTHEDRQQSLLPKVRTNVGNACLDIYFPKSIVDHRIKVPL